MEKVRECGLKLSREETGQVGKVGGEEEREEMRPQVSGVVVGNLNSMMKGEDTRWQRRAAARHENFDLDSCYDVSEKHLETNLQAICIAVSLSMTVIGA